MRCAIAIAAGFLVASSAILESPAVRQALTGPEIPGSRECSPSGTKCAGEDSHPAVPYAKCCDTVQKCGYPKSMPKDKWGRYCLSGDLVTSNKSEVVTSTASPSTTIVSVTDKDGNTVTSAVTSPTTGKSTTGKVAEKSPAPADADNKGTCFPSFATVELKNGSVVRMDSLSVGEMVKVGVNEYSRVFLFTHKLAGTENKFITLSAASGAKLSLTHGHFIYSSDALVPASTVKIGDSLTLADGMKTSVTGITQTTEFGLFNPQTVSGDLVVDGVKCSTYTTAVSPTLAHAILAPFRALQNLVTFTGLESDGGLLPYLAFRATQLL